MIFGKSDSANNIGSFVVIQCGCLIGFAILVFYGGCSNKNSNQISRLFGLFLLSRSILSILMTIMMNSSMNTDVKQTLAYVCQILWTWEYGFFGFIAIIWYVLCLNRYYTANQVNINVDDVKDNMVDVTIDNDAGNIKTPDIISDKNINVNINIITDSSKLEEVATLKSTNDENTGEDINHTKLQLIRQFQVYLTIYSTVFVIFLVIECALVPRPNILANIIVSYIWQSLAPLITYIFLILLCLIDYDKISKYLIGSLVIAKEDLNRKKHYRILYCGLIGYTIGIFCNVYIKFTIAGLIPLWTIVGMNSIFWMYVLDSLIFVPLMMHTVKYLDKWKCFNLLTLNQVVPYKLCGK